MKKKILPVAIVILLILLLSGGLAGSYLIEKYTPTKEHEELSDFYGLEGEDRVAIILNQEVLETRGLLKDGSVYLDYDFVRENLNPHFYWDSNEELLFYSLDRELLTITADASSYTQGISSCEFEETICFVENGLPYISLKFIEEHSSFTATCYNEPARLVITTATIDVDTARISKDTELRHKGGIKSPILKDVKASEQVYVLAVDETWTKVLTEDGIPGYVKSNLLTAQSTATLTAGEEKESFTHILMDEPVCLAWHQVTNQTANRNLENVLASTKGINVISPTWFYLNDNEGNIADLGSIDYVTTCHSRGIKVWGLVSNLENSSVSTTTVLTHSSLRQNLVNQIIAAAIRYQLDGINVDFESLESEVGDGYIQFIRELSIKCANNDLCLSVDNYVPYPYTAFYNRSEQGLYADYVIIMGYDEHYNGSDSGSVASLGWVENGVSNTLEEVDAGQTILGIPFYTRIWKLIDKQADVTDSSDESSIYDVSSAVYSMSGAAAAVEEAGAAASWDEESGQYYAEWTQDTITYRCWLEESESISRKLDLVDSYSLGGAAFWKLGFEDSSVWDTISEKLK